MSIRRKMFAAMAVMVVLICSTFIQLSVEFLADRFDRYVAAVGIEQWTAADVAGLKSHLLRAMAFGSTGGAIFTGLIGLLIGYILIRTFTKPLQRLIPAIQKVADNDFSFQLNASTNDEFGQLTEAFNVMTRRLGQAEQARTRLVADVAHELRTPLAIMQSRLEVIQEAGQAVRPEVLLPLQDELARLTGLVDDLHQLTLAEAGQLPLRRQETELSELVQKVADILHPAALERQVKVSLSFEATRSVASVDPRRIVQVFYNLLSNAIRHSSPGGTVTIRMTDSEQQKGSRRRAETPCVSITIADTGGGIPADELPFVFNRFYRVGEARSRHAGGTGLGLAIAKEFVEAHGGRITVQSDVGKGTEFVVFLPV
jgi:two-component system sensor histidine kinase BaeS